MPACFIIALASGGIDPFFTSDKSISARSLPSRRAMIIGNDETSFWSLSRMRASAFAVNAFVSPNILSMAALTPVCGVPSCAEADASDAASARVRKIFFICMSSLCRVVAKQSSEQTFWQNEFDVQTISTGHFGNASRNDWPYLLLSTRLSRSEEHTSN